MNLNSEEQAMMNGDLGYAKKWAIDHMVKVGDFFDAEEFVCVSQAHMMADPESIGEIGIQLLEKLAASGARVSIPMITDPRGVDLNHYRPLGQSERMAELERRTISACEKMGILMTNTCINYQTILPPIFGERVAFGDTGVVIYSNSICGARSNFEGGPSALAAGLTGRTPNYGFHLPKNRFATRRFEIFTEPQNLTEWGILGAVIGKKVRSYWEVPVIEGLESTPTSDEMKHFGAAMASYGSTALFHLVGVTPEAPSLEAVKGHMLVTEEVKNSDLELMHSTFRKQNGQLDLVVFAAPQLSLIEIQKLFKLCSGLSFKIPVLICTSPQVYAEASRLDLVRKIEESGAKVLEGTCFYNQYAREIGIANGWKRLLTNSVKLSNIVGGYGYEPVLKSMEVCVKSAVLGEVYGS